MKRKSAFSSSTVSKQLLSESPSDASSIRTTTTSGSASGTSTVRQQSILECGISSSTKKSAPPFVKSHVSKSNASEIRIKQGNRPHDDFIASQLREVRMWLGGKCNTEISDNAISTTWNVLCAIHSLNDPEYAELSFELHE